MRQTTLSVALEVKPESYDHLSSLLDKLREKRNPDPSGGTAALLIRGEDHRAAIPRHAREESRSISKYSHT